MNAVQRKRLRNRKYETRQHKQARREVVQLTAAGLATCWRCGEPIEPGEPVDVGHDDHYPHLIAGPEHARCNRAAPHRNSVSREW